jgi:hypothetical protein
MDHLFNTYIEEMIFSIYSMYYKKVGDYNIASYKYRYINLNDRDDLQQDMPLKQMIGELKLETITVNIQNDLSLMSELFKGLENELSRMADIEIEIGENYLNVFLERIECLSNIMFCSKEEIVDCISDYKSKFMGMEGTVLLETLLLIRNDIKKNKKDWHRFYVKNYRCN